MNEDVIRSLIEKQDIIKETHKQLKHIKNEMWKLYSRLDASFIKDTDKKYVVTREGEIVSLIGLYPKVLKPKIDEHGYKHYRVKAGGRTEITGHRAVAETFIEKPKAMDDLVVNHKDENPSNNHIDNLEWVTMVENMNYGTCQQRRELKRKLTKQRKEQK